MAEADALGSRTTFYYDPFSRRIATEDALGYRTSTLYDLYGREVATDQQRFRRRAAPNDPVLAYSRSEPSALRSQPSAKPHPHTHTAFHIDNASSTSQSASFNASA